MANNPIDDMSEKLEKVDSMVKEGDMLLAGANLYVTSLIESYKEERLETQRLHEKEVRHWKHVVIALVLTLAIFIGSVVGGAIYVLTNFDIMTGEFAQAIDIGGDGNPIINDGIHYDRTD